jgi:hypothetical protein
MRPPATVTVAMRAKDAGATVEMLYRGSTQGAGLVRKTRGRNTGSARCGVSLDKLGVELTVSRDTSVPLRFPIPKGEGAWHRRPTRQQCREGRPMPKLKPSNRR